MNSPLDQFIDSLRRRMFALRAIERVGLSLLGGCVTWLILLPILLLKGLPTGNPLIAILCLACFSGILWALVRPPTRLAAAIETDRQLHLKELISSALMLHAGQNDMSSLIIAQAEARCATLRPSAVLLNKLGVKSWGTIALSLALATGVALATAQTPDNTAQAFAGPQSWRDAEKLAPDPANATRLPDSPDMRRVKQGTGADETDPLKSQTPETQPDPTPAKITPSNPGSEKTSSPGDNSAGGGSAQGNPTGTTPKPNDPVTGGSDHSTTQTGTRNTGGGGATDSARSQDNAGGSGHSAGESRPKKPAPVWKSQSWPQDQAAAASALNANQIPDAYRDLVRAYFERR